MITENEARQAEDAIKTLNKIRRSVQRRAGGLRVHWFLDASRSLCLLANNVSAENSADDIIFDATLEASSGGDW